MSPPRALVIGGTRYFGKVLVERLLETGKHVTLLTRGQATDLFGARVERLVADREDEEAFSAAARGKEWDLVFDQICYAPSDAEASCRIFEGRVGRYIHTSTQSVYVPEGRVSEKDFDPRGYGLRSGKRSEFDYPTGKRLAEAVFFQCARFPVAAMRIPIVFGEEDYTRRLHFHVERVREGRPIVVPNLDAEVTLIEARDAGRALAWLGEKEGFTGPLNVCPDAPIRMKDLLATIARVVKRDPKPLPEGNEIDCSPLTDGRSRTMSPELAEGLGFRCTPIAEWLPALVSKSAELDAKNA